MLSVLANQTYRHLFAAPHRAVHRKERLPVWVKSGGRGRAERLSGLPPRADVPMVTSIFGSGPKAVAHGLRAIPIVRQLWCIVGRDEIRVIPIGGASSGSGASSFFNHRILPPRIRK
jgi:hypothetical protein